MNLIELRHELNQQAGEVDVDVDLLPGSRRRGQAARTLRVGAAAASVALVTAASVAVAPDLMQNDGPAPAAAPAASEAGVVRRPVLSVIDSGQSIELSPGVRFTITGKNYRITGPWMSTRDYIRTPSYGEQGIHVGRLPEDRLHSLNIFPGNAVRVIYAVRLLGESKATVYEADVYRLSSAPGWTMAYATYPAKGMLADPGPKPGFEQRTSVTYTAYDASGKVIPKPTPR